MNIILIIIIIVMIFVIIASLYPFIKYHYLKKSKPKEFVKYANDKWLIPEVNSLDIGIIDLESEINLLDNNTNQMYQTMNMGIQLAKNFTSHEKIKPTVENSLYDRIENKCKNCLYKLDNIRKYALDINSIERYSDNPIVPLNILNENIETIKNKFRNTAFGMFKTLEDANRMAREKELKEESIKLMINIKKEYVNLRDILNRKEITHDQDKQPISKEDDKIPDQK